MALHKNILVKSTDPDKPNEFLLNGYLRSGYFFNTSKINAVYICFDTSNTYYTIPAFTQIRIFAEDTSKYKSDKIQTQVIKCYREGLSNDHIRLEMVYTIYTED